MPSSIVSVAMPAYNAADTIYEAVRSVLTQSLENLELIVCDDASNDATAEILSSFQDPRLRIVRNNQNLGEGKTRDRAIDMAQSPWIAVIDSDDVWSPNRLDRLLAATEMREDVLVFDDLLMCHDVDNVMVPWQPLRGMNAFGKKTPTCRDIQLESYITSPRLLIKPLFPTQAVRKHHIHHSDRRFGADTEYFLRLASTGLQYRYLPEALYLYRIKAGSATAKATNKTLMRQCIESCAAEHEWPASVMQAFDKKISMLHCNEVLYAVADDIKKGHALAAMTKLVKNRRAIKAIPVSLKRYLSYQAHRLTYGGTAR